MKDPKFEKFLSLKDNVIENLNILRANLNTCTEQLGMDDPESILYNKTIELIDDIEAIELTEELDEIIIKAQDIEKAIDLFLAREGQNTLGLTWPDVSSA